MSQEQYIRMDVHQATISVAVMDAQGKLIMECLYREAAEEYGRGSVGARMHPEPPAKQSGVLTPQDDRKGEGGENPCLDAHLEFLSLDSQTVVKAAVELV